ncbi:sulfite exporter TauE/SafE family protein [Hankyongella ginsenosidimutans]|uniref:sulfite exporter TauE/SafE family protein n=1 Tax=Hankyongella ginsenosidimutans TaxID=1763828 RepID=UPI00319E24E7
MDIYLPIAEQSVNALVIIGLGAVVGMLSGLFGVGGGFLTTPLLIFYGIPPSIAVASASTQITGASVSGAIAHWRRKGVDARLGLILVIGGLLGSAIGSFIFKWLKAIGQIDFVIAISYALVLGSVGGLMVAESITAMVRATRAQPVRRRRKHDGWPYKLPWPMRFHRAGIYVSPIGPLLMGAVVGMLTAIMGVGGGFLLVPAMIYMLGVSTAVVVGTSLFQIIFTTAAVTMLHAFNTQTVDVVLALLLLIGGVVGASSARGWRSGSRRSNCAPCSG